MKDCGAPEDRRATVAVLGGGLAGLAAAMAASEHGLGVELFEARRTLGGRAGSFCDPHDGQWLDLGQHVSMGCCTNLADLCHRAELDDAFIRYGRLHFIGPDGRQYDFSAARGLPAPLDLLPGLLRLRYLRLADRLRIARTMLRLARRKGDDEGLTVGEWLRREGESEEAIARFWSVVLVSALGETVERASLAAARKVFQDGFLASRTAYQVLVPDAPFGAVLDERLGGQLVRRGAVVHRSCRVRRVEGTADRAEAVILADGTRRAFDYYLLAVPWRAVRGLLSEPLLAAVPSLEHLGQIEPSPITTVHLWFDRPITDLPHAALVGQLGQWVFSRGLVPHGKADAGMSGRSHYYQVVVSASRDLKGRPREEVVAQVRGELDCLGPEAAKARILRWRLVTEPAAVFSVRPGLDRLRPPQRTPVSNLMLSGDWTATGWPATMESAVRSGYLAVEAIFDALGTPRRILAADLPRGRLTRWLF